MSCTLSLVQLVILETSSQKVSYPKARRFGWLAGIAHLKALVAQGAEPFTADLTDTASATKAFVGAKAVYVMMPPNIASPDFGDYKTASLTHCDGSSKCWRNPRGHAQQHRSGQD